MKLRGLILIVAGMLFTSQVAADDLRVFLACIEIENDIARLQCFDEAAANMGELREEPADESSESQQTSESAARPPTDPSKVKEADENMVEGYEFLGTVVGKSG